MELSEMTSIASKSCEPYRYSFFEFRRDRDEKKYAYLNILYILRYYARVGVPYLYINRRAYKFYIKMCLNR